MLRLVAEGIDAAEIAGRLFLSAGTVRNYITAIVAKLNARNRVDAVRIARGRAGSDRAAGSLSRRVRTS
nr:hypothetical protein GCM10020093_068690 [Planobispora longispora]